MVFLITVESGFRMGLNSCLAYCIALAFIGLPLPRLMNIFCRCCGIPSYDATTVFVLSPDVYNHCTIHILK